MQILVYYRRLKNIAAKIKTELSAILFIWTGEFKQTVKFVVHIEVHEHFSYVSEEVNFAHFENFKFSLFSIHDKH